MERPERLQRPRRRPLFSLGSWSEDSRIAGVLRKETVGGLLLLVATLAALIWSNSPWSGAYESLGNTAVGPASIAGVDIHLDLTLATWAADGLLAIFFFVAGLELKREFVAGDLRDPRRAALPVLAAVGGVIVPAAIFLALNLSGANGASSGWAIPTATDIAFALAVLAVIGSYLPAGLRTFLLTLAVVDDLIAITIIAFFYTDELTPVPLLLALRPARVIHAARAEAHPLRLGSPASRVPHVGARARVRRSCHRGRGAARLRGAGLRAVFRARGRGSPSISSTCFRPLSAGVAVPVFAFFSAGVAIGGLSGLGRSLQDSVALGIVLGLVVGKPIGILLTTWLMTRFTRASLPEGLAWIDVLGVSILAGIGFTV